MEVKKRIVFVWGGGGEGMEGGALKTIFIILLGNYFPGNVFTSNKKNWKIINDLNLKHS